MTATNPTPARGFAQRFAHAREAGTARGHLRKLGGSYEGRRDEGGQPEADAEWKGFRSDRSRLVSHNSPLLKPDDRVIPTIHVRSGASACLAGIVGCAACMSKRFFEFV